MASLALPAISLGASLLGSIFGNSAAKKQNALMQQQLNQQQPLINQQVDVSKYIEDLSKQLMAKGSTQVDPYGGTTGYDPTTGTYKSTLGAVPQTLQNASDTEELTRYLADQAIRRHGLNDAEAIRARAAAESGGALDEVNNLRRGIGAVDPVALAARMRLDRTGAVNAGYDEGQRAAQTLQTRTGSASLSDALDALARRRVAAQAQIGDPEVEALQTAEGINQGRMQALGSRYSSLADRGQNFYDAQFNPAPYAATAAANTADNMKFDLSKYDVAQGGSGTAAAGLGSAAANLRQAFAQSNAGTVKNPNGDLVANIGNALTAFGKSQGWH